MPIEKFLSFFRKKTTDGNTNTVGQSPETNASSSNIRENNELQDIVYGMIEIIINYSMKYVKLFVI